MSSMQFNLDSFYEITEEDIDDRWAQSAERSCKAVHLPDLHGGVGRSGIYYLRPYFLYDLHKALHSDTEEMPKLQEET